MSGSDDYTKNSIFLTFATQGYPLFEPMVSSFKTDGELSLGLLSVSDDAVRFGRYSGLDELPYEEIMQSVVAFKGREKRPRKPG